MQDDVCPRIQYRKTLQICVHHPTKEFPPLQHNISSLPEFRDLSYAKGTLYHWTKSPKQSLTFICTSYLLFITYMISHFHLYFWRKYVDVTDRTHWATFPTGKWVFICTTMSYVPYTISFVEKNWRCRGSNPRPSLCERDALPLSYIPFLLTFFIC